MRTRAGARAGFAAALRAYTHALQARGCATGWVQQSGRVLQRLARELRRNGVRDPRAVEEGHVFAFARRLMQGGRLGPHSLGTYLGVVRAFFGFLEGRGLILRDPARGLTLPRWERLPRSRLSRRQAQELMQAPSAGEPLGRRDRAVLELLYGSGLRVGECERLDLSDVELSEGTLLVREGKGRRDRVVPLTARALCALEGYLRDSRPRLEGESSAGALFLRRGGARLSRQSLEKLVAHHGRRMGLGFKLSPHLLRHACATHLVRNGADVRHVQALLGHRDLNTTALYTRVAVRDLARLIEEKHPRGRRGRRAPRR